MTEHTPLPWVAAGAYTTAIGQVTADGQLGKFIARVAGGDFEDIPEDAANAAYIVRACNAYPAILAALTALLAEAEDPLRCASNGTGHFLSAATRERVRAALDGAGGER